jgi:hypothetical protein
MDIFSKKSGNYWATVSIDEDLDGTFSWFLRLALYDSPDKTWMVGTASGFKEVSVASAEGMEALSLLDAGSPSMKDSAADDGQMYSMPRLH